MASRRPTKPERYRHVRQVNVFLWGHHVGAVALDPAYGYYVFAYTPAFQATGIEPAPLHMPLAGGEPYLFTDLPEATYQRLPAMLSDALPDDFGNALIDRWMAERGIAAHQISSLDRLAYMSSRAMGAQTFEPARGPGSRKTTAIVLSQLVDQARRALSGQIDDDAQTEAALRNLIEVGTSAGGARAKAVVAWNPSTDELRSGQLEAPPGFEHWLLKFDGMGRDRELGALQAYGRIEYAYHLMARAAGIRMSDCRLLEENGRAHFMTRRFDRGESSQRHHVQTLCAMDHLDYRRKGSNAYAQLFLVIQRLGLGYEALEEAFRRMVFNVMARNCDDHTKNIAFLLRQGRSWELAPAYDLSFAHNPEGAWTHQHLMSVNGRFKDFTVQDFLAEADRFAIGTAKHVIAQVRSAIQDWPTYAGQSGVPEGITRSIGAQHLLLEDSRVSR